ncbi:MAG: GCN5-related N-acetyltransferase [Parcubacteria group bacterium GW2011_GWA2_33_14]|nr:MAG: GCN5-related N-acetyltransferase [Parcubacteria group bacterium GW2011_GWA2_33_14]
MSLTLSEVEKNPKILTSEKILPNGEAVIFRPLEHKDAEILADFLEGLSTQTREFYSCESYDLKEAQKYCEAIHRYDKLRFIVISKAKNKMIALFEYSFDVPESDRNRFLTYEEKFDFDLICRMGPCIADAYQNQGTGTTLFPFLVGIAQQFGCKQIILWGGVLSHNERAIKFYKKNGFRELGNFKNNHHKESIDMILDIK